MSSSRNVSVVSGGNSRQNTKDEYLLVPGQTNPHYATKKGVNEGVTCKTFLCGTKRRSITCYCASLAIFLLL